MPRVVDSEVAQYISARRDYASGDRDRAIARLVQHASQSGDALVTAMAAAWAADAGMFEDAQRLVGALEALDPRRAHIERLWLEYRRGEAGTGPVEQTVESAFAQLDLDGAPGSCVGECGRLALVLGKLLCDHGYLGQARQWLIAAMSLFRREGDIQSLAAAYGSCAEVLYLGGAPLVALELLSVDDALLTPGSVERDRLMVYRAHCLRELGEIQAARNLYTEARAVARLRGRADSPWAARGLAWCLCIEAANGGSAIDAAEMRGLLAACSGEPYSHSMGALALAWVHQSRGESRQADQWRELASRQLIAGGHDVEAALAQGAELPICELPWAHVKCPIGADACDEPFLAEQLRPREESIRRAVDSLTSGTSIYGLTAAFF